MDRALIVLLILSSFSACKQSDSPVISFYYWKTTFSLDPVELSAIADNKVSKLYIRYFDVTMVKGAPFPVRPIVFTQSPPKVTVVPVVYIRNEVMLGKDLDVKALAQNILDYIGQINGKHGIEVAEIQIDCDWSLRSRDNFLEFIKVLKSVSGKKLSATIRLHQIKYFKDLGIPEVDYGVLMYYNMGHISADSSNSIYDRETAHRYLPSLKVYPINLDVAIPLFSWGIHSRKGKVIGLLNQWTEQSVADTANFRFRNAHFYEAKHNFINRGHFFQEGDVIKLEAVASSDVLEMATDIGDHVSRRPSQVIFYDLDKDNLSKYNDEKDFFEEISDAL